MSRARFMQSCQHRVDGPYAALRRYEDVGPAFARMGRAVPVSDRLERPHDGSSDGDHPSSRSVRRVDRLRGLGRDPVELLVGRLVIFQAAYLRGVDTLVVAHGPALPDVAVPDG